MNSEAKLGARVMTTGTYADQVQIKQELVIDLKNPSLFAASPNAPMDFRMR